MGINRILSRVSEAYGRMMLYEGLFQADGHPGNILVMKGAFSSEARWLYVCRCSLPRMARKRHRGTGPVNK